MSHAYDNLYILEGHTPVAEPDLEKWGQWWKTADRVVARTEVGQSLISTVFLGVDHRFFGEGPRFLFETMIFRNGKSDELWRCATWAEAEKQHAKAVAQCEAQ